MTIQQKDQEIEKLKRTVGIMSQRIVNLQDQKGQLVQQLIDANVEIENYIQSDRTHAQNVMDELSEDVDKLKDDLKEKKESLDKYKQDLALAKSKIQELESVNDG